MPPPPAVSRGQRPEPARAVIGDEMRIPFIWCEFGTCDATYTHPDALGDRREAEPEPLGLLDVPGRADAEARPALREHVKGGDLLGQQGGLAVDDAGDERVQPHPFGVRGEEGERRVRLEHLALDVPYPAELPEVVHNGDPRDARRLGISRVARQRPSEDGRPAAPGEVGDVQAQFHASPLPVAASLRTAVCYTAIRPRAGGGGLGARGVRRAPGGRGRGRVVVEGHAAPGDRARLEPEPRAGGGGVRDGDRDDGYQA